jgi:uncharacterized protein (TIGR02452 family)
MIKRSGVEVMNERTKNVTLAKATLEILKQKQYTSLSGNVVDISGALDAAIEGTVYYPEGVTMNFPDQSPIHPQLEVTGETTAIAGARLRASGKDVVALNFASARNQGGGFLSGALAQEEDLCRCSGLYACIRTKPLFYNTNILCDNNFYTDGVIYSPKVPFFRDEHYMLLEQPFDLSIISAPAPNVTSMKGVVDEDVLIEKLLTRAIKVLQVAHLHGHKHLVLGAWGCGAFGNNPKLVATVFVEALRIVPAFETVCFAVYDTRTPPVLYEAFQQICGHVSW